MFLAIARLTRDDCGILKSIIVLRSTDRFGLGKQVAELGVVYLHAVIEIEAEFLIGGVLELFLEDEQFGLLLLEIGLLLLELVAMARAGRFGLVTFELLDTGGDLALEWDDVLSPHSGQRAFMVAVQVDEALEGPLFAAGEQPVDRTGWMLRPLV